MKSTVELEINLENLERDIWDLQDDIRGLQLSVGEIATDIVTTQDEIKDLDNKIEIDLPEKFEKEIKYLREKFDYDLDYFRETLERQINMLEDRIDELQNRFSA